MEWQLPSSIHDSLTTTGNEEAFLQDFLVIASEILEDLEEKKNLHKS